MKTFRQAIRVQQRAGAAQQLIRVILRSCSNDGGVDVRQVTLAYPYFPLISQINGEVTDSLIMVGKEVKS